MDSFELNKIIAAILLTALIIIGIGKFADIVFHVDKPEQSAYKIEGLEAVEPSKVAGQSKTVEKVDINQLLIPFLVFNMGHEEVVSTLVESNSGALGIGQFQVFILNTLFNHEHTESHAHLSAP